VPIGRLSTTRKVDTLQGVSYNNRKAKFHAITSVGCRQLGGENRHWERLSGVIARLLRTAEPE
jgi:hypothetical protein